MENEYFFENKENYLMMTITGKYDKEDFSVLCSYSPGALQKDQRQPLGHIAARQTLGRSTTRSRVPDPSAAAAHAPDAVSVCPLRTPPPALPPSPRIPAPNPSAPAVDTPTPRAPPHRPPPHRRPSPRKPLTTAANSGPSPSSHSLREPSPLLRLAVPRRAKIRSSTRTICHRIAVAVCAHSLPPRIARSLRPLSAADLNIAIASLTAP